MLEKSGNSAAQLRKNMPEDEAKEKMSGDAIEKREDEEDGEKRSEDEDEAKKKEPPQDVLLSCIWSSYSSAWLRSNDPHVTSMLVSFGGLLAIM